MKIFKDILQGAGDLPGYGPHPGTGIMFVFLLMGGLAGVDRGGWVGFLGGAAFAALFVVPLWCVGCVDRARSYQLRNRQPEQ